MSTQYPHRRFQRIVRSNGFRLGVAVSSVIAMVGSLGAPFKWG